VDLEAVVTRGVAIAVHDLPFFNTSEYECRWSTFYWPHFTLPNSREGDRLLCHLPKKHPIAKDPTPALTPLPPAEGSLDHTLGGTGRLTILLVGANRLRWKATRVVAEETIFLVRGSLLNRTPDPSDRHTAEWFQKYVNDSQNPTDCSSARVAVVTDLHVAGLGCQLLMLAGLLLQSLQQGTVLLLTFTWNYARGLTPPMWQALFRPISSCEATLFPNQSSLRVPRHQVARTIKARYSREYFYPTPDWGRGLPAAFAARGYGWVIGQLLRYIVRPVDPIARLVAEAERRLQPHRPFICLSIRQGERGTSLRKLPPHRMPRWEALEVVELLRALAATHREAAQGTLAAVEGTRHHEEREIRVVALIVSDNAALVDNVLAHGRRESLPVHSVGSLGRRRAVGGNDCLREKEWVGCSTSVDDARVLVLVDFFLLTRCRHFVGTLSSGFSRVAHLINAAYGHNASLGISLE